jgi:hypothetical protein
MKLRVNDGQNLLELIHIDCGRETPGYLLAKLGYPP